MTLLCLGMGFNIGTHAVSVGTFFGPRPTQASEYETMSCRELYREATLLEPQTQHFRSPQINEQTDLLATTIGTVFEPAFYYFGFSVPWQYQTEYRIHHTTVSLDSIRQRMASLRCFEK